MLDELQDGQESENTDESQDLNTDAELIKAREIAQNQKIRAEKAEAELKTLKKAPEEKETPKNPQFSLADIRALSDVNDEDVEDVVEYAKFKGISPAEAKKSPVIQTLLKTKAEERATAAAANTGNAKRGSSITSDEALLNEASATGKLPETDAEMDRLADARWASKKKRA
jgi:hypothetical protein